MTLTGYGTFPPFPELLCFLNIYLFAVRSFVCVCTQLQYGKYSIGDGESFSSLAQLVNYYRSHPMSDKSGIKVTLKQVEFISHTTTTLVYVGQLNRHSCAPTFVIESEISHCL